MMYKPSEKLLGVWVTRPLFTKKYRICGYTTNIEAVVSADYVRTTYEFHDSYNRHLGHPLSTDYTGNGLHNLVKVELKPVWVGWTRDGGKSFITDDDMIKEKGMDSLGATLKELGYVPGRPVSKTVLSA